MLGDGKVATGALVGNSKTGDLRQLELQGFFVAIGHQPNTAMFAGQLELDDQGYIKTIGKHPHQY